MRLCIVIPSNNPDEFFNVMAPTLHHLRDLDEGCDLSWSLVLQDPWKMDDRMEAVEIISETLQRSRIESILISSISPPPMAAFRDMGAMMDLYADVWLQIDDNLQFKEGTKKYPRSSGQRYLEVLDYFEKEPLCGSVQCHGAMGGNYQKWAIQPTRNGLVSTTRGLFVRNVDSMFMPEPYLRTVASMEETPPVYRLIEMGYFPAKQFNNPTYHELKGKTGEWDLQHSKSLQYQNIGRIIREEFEDPDWDHESRKFPKRLHEIYSATDAYKNPEAFRRDYQPS